MPAFCANLSLLFRELPWSERFAAARAAGFEAVEIQFPYELDVHDIRRELVRHGLRLVLINVPAGDLMAGGDGIACVPGRETVFRDGVEQCLRYAEALGVQRINVLAGRQPPGVAREPCLDILADNLHQAAARFAGIGALATLEAINTFDMPRFLIHDVAGMADLLDRAAHPSARMQFDIYHMARMGEPLRDSLRAHLPRIGHLQFADTPGRGQPGTGALDFNALFAEIDHLGYDGYCGAEYLPVGPTADSLHWFAPYRSP